MVELELKSIKSGVVVGARSQAGGSVTVAQARTDAPMYPRGWDTVAQALPRVRAMGATPNPNKLSGADPYPVKTRRIELKIKSIIPAPDWRPDNFEKDCKDSKDVCVLWRQQNKHEIFKLFSKLKLLDNPSVIILSPGSINPNSDWDVSLFVSKEIIRADNFNEFLDFFKREDNIGYFERYDNNYYMEPYLYKTTPPGKLEYDWIDIFNIKDSEYKFAIPKIRTIYEIEALKYKLEINGIKGVTSFDRIPYDNLIEQIETHRIDTEAGNGKSLGKQKEIIETGYSHLDKGVDGLEDFKKKLLASRFYKVESYLSQSAFLCVVLNMQLDLGMDLAPEVWLISALENAIDLYIHLNNATVGATTCLNSITNENCYIYYLKYSKYIQRIYESLLESKEISAGYELEQLINKIVSKRGTQIVPELTADINTMFNSLQAFLIGKLSEKNIPYDSSNLNLKILIEGYITYILMILGYPPVATTPGGRRKKKSKSKSKKRKKKSKSKKRKNLGKFTKKKKNSSKSRSKSRSK